MDNQGETVFSYRVEGNICRVEANLYAKDGTLAANSGQEGFVTHVPARLGKDHRVLGPSPVPIDGLWSVEFGHAGAEFQAVNAGILVLDVERVLSGDTWFAYTGRYSLTQDELTGTLKVERHQQAPGSIDAWQTGVSTFGVVFSIQLAADHQTGEGVMTRTGLQPIGVRVRKLSKLPR